MFVYQSVYLTELSEIIIGLRVYALTCYDDESLVFLMIFKKM